MTMRRTAPGLDMDISFQPLQGHADLAPLLAAWHHAEFGYLYDPLVWNLEIARLAHEAMAEPGSDDVTWVAFDGPIADADSLLGSVSLIRSDDLPGFEDLTPWLASLLRTAMRTVRTRIWASWAMRSAASATT